jgi:hypothetical protein
VVKRSASEARSARVEGYRGFGGIYDETAPLAHLLAHHGHPVSEGLLLAVSGGVGFSYNVYPGAWGVHLALGFGVPAGAGVLARAVGERLGVPTRVDETGNGVVAERQLLTGLAQGEPALLWGARGRLPYFAVREELVPLLSHQWVVWGYDARADTFLVADLAPGPLEVRREQLAAARSGLFSAKHRRLAVQAGEEPLDLERAARRGLRAGLEALEAPLLLGQGLPGLARWADLLVDPQDARGWPRFFWSGGALFYDALVAVYEAVEIRCCGGALRGLLAEALARLGATEAAERYRDLAAGWSALASAALPAGYELLARTRRALTLRDRLFRERGGDAAAELVRLDEDLLALRREATAAPAVPEREAAELRGELSRRLLELHRGEREAARALGGWLSREPR